MENEKKSVEVSELRKEVGLVKSLELKHRESEQYFWAVIVQELKEKGFKIVRKKE